MSFERQNVGAADAWIRRGIALLLFAFIFYILPRVPSEWFLTVALHPAILAAYLLLTATARACFFYEAVGLDTARRRAPPMARPSAPPRTLGPTRGIP